jgi:hypothetical protein
MFRFRSRQPVASRVGFGEIQGGIEDGLKAKCPNDLIRLMGENGHR